MTTTVPANTTLFYEDDPSAGLYVLLRGEVHMQKLGPQGQEHIMAVVKPITVFNEVSVLDGGPNPATAVTTQESLLWHTGFGDFRRLINRYPQMAVGLLPILAARNRGLVAQYEDLSFRTVRARTAKLLLHLSAHGEQSIPRRTHPITELAGRIATAPEVVSRALAYLRDNDLIATDRVNISVLDPQALAELAQMEIDFSGEG